MSRLITNAIRSTSASSDAMTIDSAGKPAFPNGGVGKIIQVVSTTKTDTFSHTGSTSFVDVTGLSVSITPTNASNKILVLYDLNWSSTGGHLSCRLMRDSTAIKVGDAAGSNRPRVTGQAYFSGDDQYDIVLQAGTFLDSPNTTSSITYKWQVATPANSSHNIYVNRQGAEDNGDQAYNGRSASAITVMEVAA
tara:strand:- start:22 stop:600 length:579 start_codon:yes stop_codon:yes gene_type:complete